MSENVIILGAGFSRDAGIPLLGEFIDRMLDIAVRGKVYGEDITRQDHELIQEAMSIRAELDNIHGRAVFDDRNIEDILSVLAFNVLGGGKKDKNKFDTVTRAICRTIELCSTIVDPRLADGHATVISDSPHVYRTFWHGMFEWVSKGNSLPPIITFNYDLVLELSLLQLLNNTIYNQFDKVLPFKSIGVHYSHPFGLDSAFGLGQVHYGIEKRKLGTITTSTTANEADKGYQRVDILKLHGSLNFPKNAKGLSDLVFGKSVENPGILPPVSNKLSGKAADEIWRAALLKLRSARNVVFVGYSLPQTDMYMQYFLKAALGPNLDLDKITVFDPVLFKPNSTAGGQMRDRFEMCFSENMRKRIYFTPARGVSDAIEKGTTEHFVNTLMHRPAEIFF